MFNELIKIVERFLWWCAGANANLIQECPSEKPKYSCIGASVLLTGLLASMAGGYALYSTFHNYELGTGIVDPHALFLALIFGILWGVIIFNIDRFIVSTFHKSNASNAFQRAGADFMHALPRIAMAIIIALTISKPIQVKLFENRLSQQIEESKRKKLSGNNSDYQEIYQIGTLKQDVENSQSAIDALEREKMQEPAEVAAYRRQLEQLRKQAYNLACRDDSISQMQLGIVNRQIRQTNKTINSLITAHRKQVDAKIAEAQTEHEKITNIYDQNVSKSDSLIAIADKHTSQAYSNNLITQLEAMSELKSQPVFWWASLLISLLFLMIELTPILTKLIISRGSYDDLLDLEQTRILVSAECKNQVHKYRAHAEAHKQMKEIGKECY